MSFTCRSSERSARAPRSPSRCSYWSGPRMPRDIDFQRLAKLDRQFRRRPEAYAGSVGAGELKFIAFLVSTAGAGRDDRVLDVACGTGALTRAFAQRCGGAVGLDVMAPALAQARSQAREDGLVNVE